MNRVVLIGRLTRDIEVKQTNSGKSVCSFGLAVDRRGEGTDFINCQAWGKTAETMGQFLGKGRRIGIEGRLTTRNFEDRSGSKRTVTEVVADSFEFLDNRQDSAPRVEYQQPQEQVFPHGTPVGNDEIPF